MFRLPEFSVTASLIGDPARAAMLTALLDGRALPAGELAAAGGVTAQTASTHLARMLDGGLLAVEAQGRHRYYRLAGAHVALAIEQLAAIRPAAPRRPRVLSPEARRLQFCRCCYNHLAGKVGVAMARALEDGCYLRRGEDRQFVVTVPGRSWFSVIGIDVAAVPPGRRGLARQCIDCTERHPHLGGPLGVQLMGQLCAKGWLRRTSRSRVVEVTPLGAAGLRDQLGIDTQRLAASDAA